MGVKRSHPPLSGPKGEFTLPLRREHPQDKKSLGLGFSQYCLRFVPVMEKENSA